jgi:UDP-2-acetamido-2,6-beta-L-arabino-hexul-4-ose reductase
MIKIGITGQEGFIGNHLLNYLGLQPNIKRIHFNKSFFDKPAELKKFVSECDVIVHLAAMNRHTDAEVIYQTNVDLVKKLITAMEEEGVKPHVIFSSSTQEENDNPYGKSKTEGRDLLREWATKSHAPFTGLIIPNVFGPFGRPYYNSVIATFCHQLTHNEVPNIKIDGLLKLIYVGELTGKIFNIIKGGISDPKHIISPSIEINVSGILTLLNEFKRSYSDQHIFPEYKTDFELNLFNTFRSYIDYENHYPVLLEKKIDERGYFVEALKAREGGQFSFSTTQPGITRGNHFHTRKIERFTVISGKAVIELRKIGTDAVLHFELDGNDPAFVDMPVWYSHNISNVGSDELVTLFWISEFFDPEDPDTYFEKV